MKQYFYAALICWSVCLIVLLFGCTAVEHKPLPEGDPANPPLGYVLHCFEFPDSPFCKQADK